MNTSPRRHNLIRLLLCPWPSWWSCKTVLMFTMMPPLPYPISGAANRAPPRLRLGLSMVQVTVRLGKESVAVNLAEWCVDYHLMDACYKMQLCFLKLQWCGLVESLFSSRNEFIFFLGFFSTLLAHSRLPPITGNGATAPLLDSNLRPLSTPSPPQSISITLKIPSSHPISPTLPKCSFHYLLFSVLFPMSILCIPSRWLHQHGKTTHQSGESQQSSASIQHDQNPFFLNLALIPSLYTLNILLFTCQNQLW